MSLFFQCKKVPCKVCGPESCPIVTQTVCQDKEKTVSTFFHWIWYCLRILAHDFTELFKNSITYLIVFHHTQTVLIQLCSSTAAQFESCLSTSDCRSNPGCLDFDWVIDTLDRSAFSPSFQFVTSVPKETCELRPQRLCTNETKTLPSLKLVNECVDVPKEVCSLEKVNPRRVSRPIVKLWCNGTVPAAPSPDVPKGSNELLMLGPS